MKILFISQWYAPEPVSLPSELAQSLSERGHTVEVLTGYPNYPRGVVHEDYRMRGIMTEWMDKVRVVRAPLFPDHSTSPVKRVANYLSYAFSASVAALMRMKRPDVILVYHPPLTAAIPALVLSKLWRVPFVYRVHDMWPETLRATGLVTSDRVLGMVGWFARLVYAAADHVMVVSQGFRTNLIEKGVDPSKISVVSNWVDMSTYRPAEPDPDSRFAERMQGKFNVVFAGNMGEAQALETVVEAAVLLQDRPEIQFVLVGDGTAHSRLVADVQRRGLSNVVFTGNVPPTDMSQIYAFSDVLLAHLKIDPLFEITIPHKIFAYMASAKPVLAALEGEGASTVVDSGAGITCTPQNPELLAESVIKLFDASPEERSAMGDRGLEAVQRHYNRDTIVRRIEIECEKVI